MAVLLRRLSLIDNFLYGPSNIKYILFYVQILILGEVSNTLISSEKGASSSWFDSVFIHLACWINFSKNYHNKGAFKVPDYNL